MSFDIDGYADETDTPLLRIDGFDDCCVGVIERCGCPSILCYSTDQIIESLVAGGLDYDEAREHFEFNISGAWMGELTPCFLEVPE